METTRRRFLGAAAATLGATAGFELLPTSLQKAMAATPENDLTQENRSFDHYFGTLSGVRGFDDPHPQTLPSNRSVFYQPDPQNPDGYVLPFRLDTTKTNAAAIHDPGHGWPTQHQAWNDGKMDNWVPAQRAAVDRAGQRRTRERSSAAMPSAARPIWMSHSIQSTPWVSDTLSLWAMAAPMSAATMPMRIVQITPMC